MSGLVKNKGILYILVSLPSSLLGKIRDMLPPNNRLKVKLVLFFFINYLEFSFYIRTKRSLHKHNWVAILTPMTSRGYYIMTYFKITRHQKLPTDNRASALYMFDAFVCNIEILQLVFITFIQLLLVNLQISETSCLSEN